MNKRSFPGVLPAIDGLWSCHGNFTTEEITEKDLQAILDAAVRAATASGQQSYSIIVVDDRSVMKALTGYDGSRALVFCTDGNRLGRASDRLGMASSDTAGMDAFVTWAVDTILAAQNACLAARGLGIDSLFTNGIMRTGLDMAYETLNLPRRGCFPLITLILGYATEEPLLKRGRLAGTGVVHRGRYHTSGPEEIDAMIAEYDDPDRNLSMSRAFETGGYAHYLEWFFKVWLGGFPENTDDAVADRLKKSGFL